MERELSNILTEVLVFPYEQSIVDSLTEACSQYIETIDIEKYEDCVLHLCLNKPAANFIEHINIHTERKFINRVYRAMTGYVIGESLANTNENNNKLMFSLALCNAMKAKNDDVDGIIRKAIDPNVFSVVENYWSDNIFIPSLCKRDLVSPIVFEKSTWSDTGLDAEENFSDIQALAKFYMRKQFNKEFENFRAKDYQDNYSFANDVATKMALQDWLFTVEKPVQVLESLDLKDETISLADIKLRISENKDVVDNNIDPMSVYRRYLYTNDYKDIGKQCISPLNFGIAIFYELLYERLKSR